MRASRTRSGVEIVFRMQDGGEARYLVEKKDVDTVLGAMAPILRAAGVRLRRTKPAT